MPVQDGGEQQKLAEKIDRFQIEGGTYSEHYCTERDQFISSIQKSGISA
ncbi:hypothetical protein ACQ4M4_12535 [Leptolyngbya sp. AN02str]